MFLSLFFFFNDTATTEIYTLSLHDALPISSPRPPCRDTRGGWCRATWRGSPCSPSRGGCTPTRGTTRRRWRSPRASSESDRKSTRLNSSHLVISYAVFCLKKKKKEH